MSDLTSLPIVCLSTVRFWRGAKSKVVPCLTWDPAGLRSALDEKPGRQPIVAMLVRTAEERTDGNPR
jgi:hypothetical protein